MGNRVFFFFFFFFGGGGGGEGVIALSRIFYLYRADRSSKMGEIREKKKKKKKKKTQKNNNKTPDHP